jgi:hypothetical protein
MELRPSAPALAPAAPISASGAFEAGLAIWTAKASARQAEMAGLTAPVVEAPMLLAAPEQVYAAGFGVTANGELRTDRFTGSAVSTVSTAFVVVPNNIQVASR